MFNFRFELGLFVLQVFSGQRKNIFKLKISMHDLHNELAVVIFHRLNFENPCNFLNLKNIYAAYNMLHRSNMKTGKTAQ